MADKQEKDFERRQQEAQQEDSYEEERRENRWGKREIEIKKVWIKNIEGKEKHVFAPDEGMIIEMDVESYSEINDFAFGIGIFNSQGICCYGTNTIIEEFEPAAIKGKGKVVCQIERLNLVNGTYYLDVAVHKRDGYPFDYHRNLYSFMVSSQETDVGIFRPDHTWKFSPNIRVKSPRAEK